MTQKRIRELEAENERLRRQVESLRPATPRQQREYFLETYRNELPEGSALRALFEEIDGVYHDPFVAYEEFGRRACLDSDLYEELMAFQKQQIAAWNERERGIIN